MSLTQKDLNEIERLIRATVKEEIKFLPTKEEFFAKMDEVIDRISTLEDFSPASK